MRGGMRRLAPLVLISLLTACAAPASPSVQGVGHAAKGPADVALERFDLAAILKTIDGRSVCRLEGGGSSGTSDRVHIAWTVTCPRPGSDRTVYFQLTDAIEAELGRIATINGQTGEGGDAAAPISTVLGVRGNAYIGSVRVLGVNGVANITTFVDIDLAIP
jgi:hypothetical protein